MIEVKNFNEPQGSAAMTLEGTGCPCSCNCYCTCVSISAADANSSSSFDTSFGVSETSNC